MPATNKDARYYSLDFWRGLACVLVVLNHAANISVLLNPQYHFSGAVGKFVFRILNHFDLGVPMFFVISGYCITAACDSVRAKPHRQKNYFFRRFRRIYPPFWIAVLVLLAAVSGSVWMGHPMLYFDKIGPAHAPSSLSIWQWAGNLTLTETWRWHVAGGHPWFFLGPSWTLCYEEQFYIICGLLLLLNHRWFFRSAAVVSLLVLAAVTISYAVKPLPLLGFFFDGYWLLFAAGIHVYYALNCARPGAGKWVGAALAAAGVLAILWRGISHNTLVEEYYVGFFFALLILVAHRWDWKIANSLLLRPITYCGVMCYSLYLIHWPVVKATCHIFNYDLGIQNTWGVLLVTIPACVLFSAAAGWGFHLLVERRFLNTPPVLPWHAVGQRAVPAPACRSVTAMPAVPPSMPI